MLNHLAALCWFTHLEQHLRFYNACLMKLRCDTPHCVSSQMAMTLRSWRTTSPPRMGLWRGRRASRMGPLRSQRLVGPSRDCCTCLAHPPCAAGLPVHQLKPPCSTPVLGPTSPPPLECCKHCIQCCISEPSAACTHIHVCLFTAAGLKY